LAEVISEVRRVPGLELFLLPPRTSDLCRLANDGPIVVINTSGSSASLFGAAVNSEVATSVK
jgi:hypothetical protein